MLIRAVSPQVPVGVGASVTVNTIDSTVQSNVTNSNLTAQKDITVTAEEFRDISQLATNAAAGGAAVGGNILITNVGKALNDADENEQAAREQIEAANAAYGDTDMLSFARDLGALEKGSIEADAQYGKCRRGLRRRQGFADLGEYQRRQHDGAGQSCGYS